MINYKLSFLLIFYFSRYFTDDTTATISTFAQLSTGTTVSYVTIGPIHFLSWKYAIGFGILHRRRAVLKRSYWRKSHRFVFTFFLPLLLQSHTPQTSYLSHLLILITRLNEAIFGSNIIKIGLFKFRTHFHRFYFLLV